MTNLFPTLAFSFFLFLIAGIIWLGFYIHDIVKKPDAKTDYTAFKPASYPHNYKVIYWKTSDAPKFMKGYLSEDAMKSKVKLLVAKGYDVEVVVMETGKLLYPGLSKELE